MLSVTQIYAMQESDISLIKGFFGYADHEALNKLEGEWSI